MSTLDLPDNKECQIKIEKERKRKRKGKERKENQSRAFRPTTICHLNELRANSLHHTSLFALGIEDGALQRAREVGMEQRPAKVVDGRHPSRRPLVHFAVLQLLA